jgi:hypothetical protein
MKIARHCGPGLLLLALLVICPNVVAHQDLSSGELVQYHTNLKRDGEALNRCLESPEMREHNARMLIHRNEILRHTRKARGIDTDSGIISSNWFSTLTNTIRYLQA